MSLIVIGICLATFHTISTTSAAPLSAELILYEYANYAGLTSQIILMDERCFKIPDLWTELGFESLRLTRGCMYLCDDGHCRHCERIGDRRSRVNGDQPSHAKSLKAVNCMNSAVM